MREDDFTVPVLLPGVYDSACTDRGGYQCQLGARLYACTGL